MVILEPDNMRWRMEAQYGDFNLGVALYDQQRYAESAALFGQALQTIQALSTADPDDQEYQQQFSEALAWLADSHVAMGQVEDGRRLREQHVSLLRTLIARSSGDVGYRQRLVLGYQRLGNIYAALGQLPEAEQNLRAAVRESDSLVAVEVGNNRWREHGARVRLRLAEYLLATGNRAEAAEFAQRGCAIIAELVAEDGTIAQRQATQRDCLLVRAKLAISAGLEGEALSIATTAERVATRVKSNDRIGDVRAIAEAHRLVGDVHQQRGDGAAAQEAWKRGLNALSRMAGDHPSTMAERAELLARAGDRGEAARLKARLSAMGFRRADVIRA
jgi:tetratricopeptide (TPR) repeat protein